MTAAVIELVDYQALRRLWRVRTGSIARIYQVASRADFFAAVTALVGVLLFDTLPGLVIGIGISLGLLLAQASRPHIAVLAPVGEGVGRPWVDVDRNPEYADIPGVLVVRVEAPLSFANADHVREQIRALAAAEPEHPRLVVFDGRSTPSMDVTAAAMLVQLRGDLRRDGAELVLANDVGQVRDVLASAEPEGEPLVYANIEDAIRSSPRGAGGGHSRDSGEPESQ